MAQVTAWGYGTLILYFHEMKVKLKIGLGVTGTGYLDKNRGTLIS